MGYGLWVNVVHFYLFFVFQEIRDFSRDFNIRLHSSYLYIKSVNFISST